MFGDVEKSIANGIGKKVSQIEQVIAASLRPLPTQTGDGSYISTPTTTGLAKDLGHMDVKDVKTLLDVMKSAATGKPINDRDYIMERVIQVRVEPLIDRTSTCRR